MPQRRTGAPAAKPVQRSQQRPQVSNAFLNKEEAHHYTNANAVMKILVDNASADTAAVPNSTMTGPMNGLSPKLVFNVNVNPNKAPAPFTMMAFPRLRSPMYTTDYLHPVSYPASTFTLDIVDGASPTITTPPGLHEDGVAICPDDSDYHSYQGDWWGRCKSARFLSYFQDGFWVVPFDFTPLDPLTSGLVVSMNSTGPGTMFRLRPHFTDGSLGAALPPIAGGDQVVTCLPGLVLDGFAVEISSGSTATPIAVTRISITTRASTAHPGWMSGSDSVLFALESDLFDDIAGIAERVTCLSTNLLVQYRGSTLDNGGTIAADQLVKGLQYSPTLDSRFDELARIPGSYNGPLRTGAYAYWTPENFLENQLVNPYFVGHSELLAVSGFIDDPTQRIVVTMTQVFRFTVLSRLYTHIYFELDLVAWEMALHMLQGHPAACCNPDHLKRIKAAVSTMWKHRDQIANGAKMAATAARAVAPLLAML